MADDQDQSSKTEEPTQRRLDQAREKGQVAVSREINNLIILGAGALFLLVFAAPMVRRIGDAMVPFIRAPHEFDTDPIALRALFAAVVGDVGIALALPFLIFVAAALLAGVIQNGIVFSASPLEPKLEKISPIAGFKRLFSLKSLVEFAKGLVKIVLVMALALLLLWPSAGELIHAAEIDPGPLMLLVADLALKLFGAVVALMMLIAAIDLAYQRYEHTKQLRMSRRDLQDEFKQTEGDPYVKARLKSLRMERSRRRMMAAVPESTAVITNPTHVAVALRYEPDETAAPVVVAKGTDRLALKIMEIARAHDVPVVQNPPLARALNQSAELDQPIPIAHYKAVAEVIGYVFRLRKRR